MRLIRLMTYKKHLEKQGYSKNTIDQYICCMDILKRNRIYEDSSSAEIYNVICDGERSSNTRLMYLKAITEYEKGVIGETNSMLKGALRERLRSENKDDPTGKEPVKTLRAYRYVIGKCDNDKLRIGMKLQLDGGLRVGEVARLTLKDITMRDGHIWLKVAPQKTVYGRHVKVIDNPKLYTELGDFLKGKPEGEVLFCKPQMTFNYLYEHEGNSHDLRRYNSRIRYEMARLEGMGKRDAVASVQKQLGHREPKMTRRYIGEVYRMDKGGKYKKGVV